MMEDGQERAIGPWLGRHRAQFRLGLRITVASLATFALAHLFGLAQSSWAVLTALIVMQASVGGSLKATVDRFVGSLGGAVWGVAVSLAVPHANPVSLGVALAAGVAPLAVVAAIRPAYRVAPVTAIILLLGPSGVAPGAATWLSCGYLATSVIVSTPLPAAIRSCRVTYDPAASPPIATGLACR